jgi:hypothetical protein
MTFDSFFRWSAMYWGLLFPETSDSKKPMAHWLLWFFISASMLLMLASSLIFDSLWLIRLSLALPMLFLLPTFPILALSLSIGIANILSRCK